MTSEEKIQSVGDWLHEKWPEEYRQAYRAPLALLFCDTSRADKDELLWWIGSSDPEVMLLVSKYMRRAAEELECLANVR